MNIVVLEPGADEECRTNLPIEAKSLIHSLTFVVASGEVQMLWIQNFEGKKSQDDFDRKRPSVNKVTCIRRHAPLRFYS